LKLAHRFTQYVSSLSIRATFILLSLSLVLIWSFIFSGLPISNEIMLKVASGHELFDVMAFYDAAIAYVMLGEYGETGRSNYLLFQFFDFIFIPCYVLGLASLLIRIFQVNEIQNKFTFWICLMPLILGVSDLLENLSLVVVVLEYPRELPVLAGLAGYLTALKHVFTFVVFGAVVIGCLNRAKIWLARK